MTKARKISSKAVASKKATVLEAKVTKPEENTSKDELVMEAKIEAKKEEPKPTKKADEKYSSTCVLTNTSQNKICLQNGENAPTIEIAPREIKSVPRDALRELLKNEMVKRFFDKGILTSTLDADSVSAHDAVVPENLKNPVERHEDGQNVKAEVKKFNADGTVKIEL